MKNGTRRTLLEWYTAVAPIAATVADDYSINHFLFNYFEKTQLTYEV